MLSTNRYIHTLGKNPVIEQHFPANSLRPFDLWPRHYVRQYQWDAIRHVIRHACEQSAYYRAKCARAGVSPDELSGWEDFQTWPFMTKDELRRKPWQMLCVPREEIAQVHVSTGTTSQSVGDHLYSLLSWDDIFVNEVACKPWLLMPHAPGDVAVVALPYEMSSAGFSMHRAYQNNMNAIAVNVGKGGWYSEPDKTLTVMKDLKANILCTTAGYALLLAEVAATMGLDLRNDIGPKLLWLGGEGFSHSLRQRVERNWGCTALTYYSSLECGPMGIECAVQSGLHIPENYQFIEIVDPSTGVVVPDGHVGEVCVTNLYRFGAPFIRYRTKDFGWIDRSPCECCLELPRLFLKGRPQDQIMLEDGKICCFEIEGVLFNLPQMGGNYFIEDRGGCYDLHVEVAAGYEPAELEHKLRLELVGRGLNRVFCYELIPRCRGKNLRVRRRTES